jgi:hypothetical protein
MRTVAAPDSVRSEKVCLELVMPSEYFVPPQALRRLLRLLLDATNHHGQSPAG